MDNDPGCQIGESADGKNQPVTAGNISCPLVAVQQSTHQQRKKNAANCTGPSASSHDRTDCLLWEQIGGHSKYDGGTSLMYRHGKAEQTNCHPHIGSKMGQNNRNLQNRK